MGTGRTFQPHVLKDAFRQRAELVEDPRVLVVAVKLPTGAVEVITNYQELEQKITYYLDNYDQQFRHHTNPDVQIVDFILI